MSKKYELIEICPDCLYVAEYGWSESINNAKTLDLDLDRVVEHVARFSSAVERNGATPSPFSNEVGELIETAFSKEPCEFCLDPLAGARFTASLAVEVEDPSDVERYVEIEAQELRELDANIEHVTDWLADDVLELIVYAECGKRSTDARTHVELVTALGGPTCRVYRWSNGGSMIEVEVGWGRDVARRSVYAPNLADYLDELATSSVEDAVAPF